MAHKTFMKGQVCEHFKRLISNECVCCHQLKWKVLSDVTLNREVGSWAFSNIGPRNLADARQINIKREVSAKRIQVPNTYFKP